MKPVLDFGKLRRRGARQLYKIREVTAWAVSPPYSQEQDRSLTWATIELLNLWSEFCRAYFLSCLLYARLESGIRVTHTSGAGYNFEQAIGSILRSSSRTVPAAGKLTRRNEPTWHDPSSLITGSNLGMSHLSQVQEALSIGSQVFSHLPVCRNFYAHRNEETALRVLRLGQSSYSIFGRTHPSQVLISPAYGRPQSLILDFVDDLWATIELLCA